MLSALASTLLFWEPHRPLPRHATRAMECRVTALAHERRRSAKGGEIFGPRVARLTLRLLHAYLAEEGLVIRMKIKGGDWRQPIRMERGPRPT